MNIACNKFFIIFLHQYVDATHLGSIWGFFGWRQEFNLTRLLIRLSRKTRLNCHLFVVCSDDVYVFLVQYVRVIGLDTQVGAPLDNTVHLNEHDADEQAAGISSQKKQNVQRPCHIVSFCILTFDFESKPLNETLLAVTCFYFLMHLLFKNINS